MKLTPEIIIYEGGEARVEVRLDRETVWLSLQQLADLFERDKSVVSRHLRNIFASGELERSSVVAKNATHALVSDEGQAVLDVVQRYARSWRLLLAYDEQRRI